MKLFFRTSTLFALFFSVISLSLPDAVEAKTGKVIKKPLSVAKSKSAKKSVKKSLAKTSGLKKTKVVAKSGSTFKDRVKARKAELLAEPARLPGRTEATRLTERPVLASVQVSVDAVSTVESLIHELGVEEVDGAQARMGEAAFSLLGKKYRFGGNGASGIDCSAFVRTVFNRLQIPLPRTAREQFALGVEVPVTDLQKGDLLFFHTYRDDASHVGIYLGNDKMIHASSSGRRVMISSTKNAYYRSRFLGARRVTADSLEATPVRNPDASLRPVLELVAESGLRAPISF